MNLETIKANNPSLNQPQVTSRLVYESEEMKSIIDIVNRIAKSNINVIVTGETGTGKEHSKRITKITVHLNLSLY